METVWFGDGRGAWKFQGWIWDVAVSKVVGLDVWGLSGWVGFEGKGGVYGQGEGHGINGLGRDRLG